MKHIGSNILLTHVVPFSIAAIVFTDTVCYEKKHTLKSRYKILTFCDTLQQIIMISIFREKCTPGKINGIHNENTYRR